MKWINAAGFAGLLMAILYLALPLKFDGSISMLLKDPLFRTLPRDLVAVQKIGEKLQVLSKTSFSSVWLIYVSIYMLLQTFAIPGSIFLSILAGYLWPPWIALFTVSLASAAGASLCFLLSRHLGRRVVRRYLATRMATWAAELKQHETHLVHYLLFLRITPFLPNWFINLVSPHLDVPLPSFFWGTFFGVAPPSFLHVQTGVALDQLARESFSLFTWPNVLFLSVASALAILPPLIGRLGRPLHGHSK